jgi:hypothetical protein
MAQDHPTRREVLKDVVYVTPAILTLTAVPAFASAGSGGNKHIDKYMDKGKHLSSRLRRQVQDEVSKRVSKRVSNK